MDFNYFYGRGADQFAFYQIPKILITDEKFAGITMESKILYSLMLDRASLSAKNGWLDEDGKAVLYLKQHDIRSYDDLEKNVKTATERFTELSAFIKEKEKRLAEIQVLKKHIFDYSKTKDVYADYRKCGYSKKFLEEHRQEILLHKAAKNAFDELHLKKLPKVKDLSAEYAEILAEKKKLYGEYRQAKKDMQEIQRAKYDIDQFLKSDEEQKKERVRKHNVTR